MKKFILAGVILLFGCMEKHSTPETYLIPEKLAGHFAVVYGQKCGIQPPMENGRRILQIPESGVLIIQPPFEAGIIDHEYFSVDSTGRRTKLNMLNYISNDWAYPGVFLLSTGTFSGKMPDGSYSSTAKDAINYNDFLLLKKGDRIDTVSVFDDHSFSDVVDFAIKNCGGN